MATVTQVTTDSISVYDERTQQTYLVHPQAANFQPVIGDVVDLHTSPEGAMFISKRVQPNPNEGIQINITQPQANVGQYYATGKLVNKWTYVLLAFFLGGIGIHHFYAGKIGAGVVSLLFSWTSIPGIIAFIEFIIACCKTPDANGMIYV